MSEIELCRPYKFGVVVELVPSGAKFYFNDLKCAYDLADSLLDKSESFTIKCFYIFENESEVIK